MGLIAIDPGNVTGMAFFDHTGRLVSANNYTVDQGLLTIRNYAELAYGPCVCIIEIPQVYPTQRQKGDQNDLIELAVKVGQYKRRAEDCGFVTHLVKPHQWKGDLPKDVCWIRASETLAQIELAILPSLPKSEAHNMHDAIGLGTWFQKRWR